jgi:hypothetical protein
MSFANTGHIQDPRAQIYFATRNAPLGFFRFHEPVGTERLPPNSTISYVGFTIPVICYNISRFNEIINLLRYTKPIHFYFDYANLSGYLQSDFESVGQQEGTGQQQQGTTRR